MDTTTRKYHLLLLALESSTILELGKMFKNHAKPALAQKRIHNAQIRASSLGSQLAISQLEDKLPDDQLPPAHGYAAIQPVTIEAGITLAMLSVVARTALVTTYRASAIAIYSANHADGWIWEVEGPDSCQFCQEKDGTVHPLSEEFESHPSCWCGPEPKIS